MSSLSPDAGQIFTCKHLMRVRVPEDCVFCHRDQLRQELKAAKHDIERLMAMASAEATEAERLRAELHAIRNQSLVWAMSCPHDCPECDRLYDVIRGAEPQSKLPTTGSTDG